MASLLSPPRELCLITSEEERGADTLADHKEKDASTGDKIAEELTALQPTRSPSSGDSKAQKLKFHSVHGTSIKLEQDGRRVVNEKELGNGIVFSHRPISIDERVCIRQSAVSDEATLLEFGVTNIDPASLKSVELPESAFSFREKQGYWLNWNWSISEGRIVRFSVSSTGDMYYNIDGKDKISVGVLSGIDTSSPLWVIVDVWGKPEAVEFVDLNEQKKGSDVVNILTRDPSSESSDQERDRKTLKFHSFHGTSMKIEQGGSRVVREKGSHGNGIVFSNRPISIDERVCIRATTIPGNYSALEFGVTNIDPASPERLFAADVIRLRPVCWLNWDWIFSEESIVQFSVSSNGDMHYSIDGEDKGIFLSGIDTSSPLWVVVDVPDTVCAVGAVEFVDWNEQQKEDVVEDEIAESPATEDTKENDASTDEEKKDSDNEEIPSIDDKKEKDAATVDEKDGEVADIPTLDPSSECSDQDEDSIGDKVAEEVTEEQPMRDPSSGDSDQEGDSEAQKLKFHPVHETEIKRDSDGRRFVEEKGCHYDGIVFSHRPISIDERVCIRLKGVPGDISGLWFGVTNIHPASLKSQDLPRNANSLLSERGYWLDWRISEGSIVQFFVSSTGDMHYSIDGEDKGIFLSGIDTSSPLWVIVDAWACLEGVEFIYSSDDGQWRRHLSSGLNAAGAVWAANNIELAVWLFIVTVWLFFLTVWIMTR